MSNKRGVFMQLEKIKLSELVNIDEATGKPFASG